MRRKKIKSFLSVCPKRMTAILVFCFSLSLQTVYGGRMLIPAGQTVGVTLDTKGLLVLGTAGVSQEGGKECTPCKGTLQEGDLILQANGKELENKEQFMEMIENSRGEPVRLGLQRKGAVLEVSVVPVFSKADGTYKIGAWVRDSIQGIGTATYYDPQNETFGALGHGVYDVDTGELLEIRTGALTEAELTEITKGKKGKAGELSGRIDLQERFAKVEQNTEVGIFGTLEKAVFSGDAIPVAVMEEVKKGKAVMLSDLEGNGVKAYEIEIETVRKDNVDTHKDMTIRITDEQLLKLTGGIVQGVSGSPIIQDGKLVGAVTHVLVNDPTRGYGIFIENMLEAAG